MVKIFLNFLCYQYKTVLDESILYYWSLEGWGGTDQVTEIKADGIVK